MAPKFSINTDKQAKRLDCLIIMVEARGDKLPLLRLIYQRASQLSVKFYRWLRRQIYDPASWEDSQARLRLTYAKF